MIISEFSGTVNTTNRFSVRKPHCIVEYNKYMGGIDCYNQMMAYYPIQRKNLKCIKMTTVQIFHLCLSNVFFVPNSDHKESLYDFCLSIIKSLLPPSDNISPWKSWPPVKNHHSRFVGSFSRRHRRNKTFKRQKKII